MTPGQFGPTMRAPAAVTICFMRTSSRAGMPSVMHTMSWMPASTASSTASAAKGAGTKIIVVFAPVSSTALETVS